MKSFNITGMKPGIFVLVVLAAATILQIQSPTFANTDDGTTTDRELLDQIRIQGMVARYYTELMDSRGRHDLGRYFTKDAVFDVNGIVSNGRDEIQELYNGIPAAEFDKNGREHIIMSNPVIDVRGNTATAHFIWTGVMNDNVRMQPRLVEQGRERDVLVKRDGRWYFTKRVVRADSGVLPRWDYTFDPDTDR